MRVSVCLGAILIPEYLDFHSGYSAAGSRIAGIYSEIYSYFGISQTNAPQIDCKAGTPAKGQNLNFALLPEYQPCNQFGFLTLRVTSRTSIS